MKKTCAAVLAVSMAILWAGGCQDEQASSDVKQSRLVAAENRDLKTQLQQETKKRDDEIKNLNTQMQTETKKRDDKIENLKTQLQTETKKRDDKIENLKTQLQTEAKKRDDEIKNLNKQLQTEKEKLNADVDNLSKQLAECVQEKQAALDRVNIKIENQSEEIVGETIIPLMKEMEELKTEIARLKAELSNCERKK